MNTRLIPRAILIGLLTSAFPAASFAFLSVGVSVGFAPPALPLYAQPPCPAPDYIWAPGYWAYSADNADYYWVPGTWVTAPAPGLLWTPGYWAMAGDTYSWNVGFWGPHVGFYGGINYGYGYFGAGFEGGYWQGQNFYYNRSVTNISNVTVTNVYSRTVGDTHYYGNRPSFNGPAGVHASPTGTDLAAAREPHRASTEPQRLQTNLARNDPALRASVNHGYPAVAATARPGAFGGRDVVPAHYASLGSSARGPQSAQAGREFTAPRVDRPVWNSSHAGVQGRAASRDESPPALGRPQSQRLANRSAPPVSSRPSPPPAQPPRPASPRPAPARPEEQRR